MRAERRQRNALRASIESSDASISDLSWYAKIPCITSNAAPTEIVVPVVRVRAMSCGRKRSRDMNHKLISASCLAAIAVIGLAPAAYADPNPHNNSCQTTELNGGGTPGNAATSPGSVFNEGLINSPNGGKGGQAYSAAQANNKVGAAAQYDTACVKTSANGTATPMQVNSSPTQIKDNSLATRNADGVISHTGNGAK